jgi:hypothetical protein
MSASTIRIRSASHRALKEIAAETGQSLQHVLDEASRIIVESYILNESMRIMPR